MSSLRPHRNGRPLGLLGLLASIHLVLPATSIIAGVAAVSVSLPRTCYAQKTGVSTQKLIDQAKEKFDDTYYDESIQKLSAALLRADITKDQKVEVYRWLGYNYIVLKQDDSAKTAFYALYAVNEDYTLPAKESPKFREPFAKYKAQWIEEGRPGKAKAAEKPLAPVVLKHAPASEALNERSLTIEGRIEDPDHRVSKVSLLYRTGTTGKFTDIAASVELSNFRATIPGTAIKPPIVEYYVQAFDKGGLPIAGRGDIDTPLRVVVQAPKEGSILSTWWFWSGTAAIVGGGILAGVLLSRSSSPGTSPTAVIPPNPNATFTVTLSDLRRF